jgi:hypothetical protein
MKNWIVRRSEIPKKTFQSMPGFRSSRSRDLGGDVAEALLRIDQGRIGERDGRAASGMIAHAIPSSRFRTFV